MASAQNPRRILLLRHAKSSWNEPALADFDRPLSARGQRAADRMGAYLRDSGLAPDLVLCSTARRAADTWTRMAKAAGYDGPVRHDDELYGASARTLIEHLRAIEDDVGCVLLVGHHPGIDDCALALVGDHDSEGARRLAAKFPTAALAVIDAPIGSWSDLAAGCGELERFVAPRDLA